MIDQEDQNPLDLDIKKQRKNHREIL